MVTEVLHGFSAGSMYGTLFLALEPDVEVAVLSVPGGLATGRYNVMRRPVLGASLQARIPSLINAGGLTHLDGVPVGTPHFNENKPFRDEAPVINTVPGAIEIQEAFELCTSGDSRPANRPSCGPAICASHRFRASRPSRSSSSSRRVISRP